jgi:SanA protein
MKKTLSRLSYFLVPFILVSIIYWDALKESIALLYKNSSGFFDFVLSIPLKFFSFGSNYLSGMDSWAWITAMLVLVTFLIIFTSVDLFITNKIHGIKKHNWQWLKMDWINSTVQKLFSGLVLLLVFMIISNIVIKVIGWNNTASLDTIEGKKSVIVLGTNKHLRNGKGENLYYTYRIDAAEELYKNGKVSMFIVSGDKTDSLNYDETMDMKRSLIARGVPANLIERDTAGYRTLDSILRIRSLFKLKEFLVVSQGFHTERALLLSTFYGMEGRAYIAQGSSTKGMIIRELMAKPKAILDVLVFNMQPKVGANYEYREAFAMDSKASAWLIVVLGISVIMILRAVFAVMDKRTDGVSKSIKIAGLTLIGSVVLTLTVYKNLDIESLNNMVKAISSKTGILEATVASKDRRQKAIKQEKIEIAKAVIERGEENKNQVLEDLEITEEDFNIELDESFLEINIEGEAIVALDNEPKYRDNFDGEEEAGFNSQSFTVDNKEEKPIRKERVASKKEEPNTISESVSIEEDNDPFSNSNSTFSNSSITPKEKVYSKTDINILAVVYGNHTLSDGDNIRLRLRQGAIINGESIARNTVFTSKVKIVGQRLIIPISSIAKKNGSLVETNLYVYDLDKVEGIKLNLDDSAIKKKADGKEEDKGGVFSGGNFSKKSLEVNVAANYEVILNQR